MEKGYLLERAILKRKGTNNIAAIARDLGINRQVLHAWFARTEKRQANVKSGKISFRGDTIGLLGILYYTTPQYFGLKGAFWTIQTLHWVCVNILKKNASVYYLKKTFYDYGFLNPAQIKKVFHESYRETDGRSVIEYAQKHNYRCYYYTAINIQQHLFLCIYSARGDVRIISCPPTTSHCAFYWSWTEDIIAHLIQKSKNKVLIIHPIKEYKPKQDFKGKCLLIERKA